MAGSLPQESPAGPAREPVPARTVREQLARVVNSPGFVSSARLTRFLSHIVNRTIDGDLDSLKEFSIAMEVFDRTADYDPNIDAIVRAEARRLSSKLKAYYEEEPVGAIPSGLDCGRAVMSRSSAGWKEGHKKTGKKLARASKLAVHRLPCCRLLT